MVKFIEKVTVLNSWRNAFNTSDLQSLRDYEAEATKNKVLYGEKEREEIAVLTARTAFLKKDREASSKALIQLEKYLKNGNEETLYYYHYLTGIDQSQNKKLEQAIYHFKRAGRLVHSISSINEKGEFHYRKALAYYEMDKITLSIKHITTSFEMFSSIRNYKKMAECQNLLGSNLNEIKQFAEAEMAYNNALKFGTKVDYQEIRLIVHHNLGHLYGEQNKPLLAIKNLEQVLHDNDYFSSYEKMKTHFLLARENYRIGDYDKAKEWYEVGMNLAHKVEDQEYTYHLRALKTKYEPDQNSCSEFENEYMEIVHYFEEKELWDYVHVYSNFLAAYFKDQDQFEEACDYYELASLAKEKSDYQGVLV